MTIPERIKTLGLTNRALADIAGVEDTQVSRWIHRGQLPSMAQAEAISEALDKPAFVEAVRKARTRTCVKCHNPFVIADRSRHDAKYCSVPCERRVNQQRRRKGGRDARVIVLMRQLQVLERVNAEMVRLRDENCVRCEPDRLCRESECPWHMSTKHACVVTGCGTHRRQVA